MEPWEVKQFKERARVDITSFVRNGRDLETVVRFVDDTVNGIIAGGKARTYDHIRDDTVEELLRTLGNHAGGMYEEGARGKCTDIALLAAEYACNTAASQSFREFLGYEPKETN